MINMNDLDKPDPPDNVAVSAEEIPMEKPSAEDVKNEKRRLMKNIVLISLCFLFVFNAFNGLARLQSSLHRVEGMGVINQSILYGALVLSCLFLPKLLISAVGHKWAIPICFSGYILWMAANGYAVWGTMATASVLVGLCAAPLWTAQCAYFTKCAARYAHISGELQADVITRFFGIFFLFFQFSTVIGSIISFTVLRGDISNVTEREGTEMCGVNDCPWNNDTNPNLNPPSQNTIWTMLGIYIGVAAIAIIILCTAVDRLPRDLRDPKVTKVELRQLPIATAMHLRHRSQCLLIPITMYSGLEQAYFNAEFSKSFISCPLGIWKVGLVTLPYGVVNAAVSYGGGHLAKYSGRLPIFIVGMCVDLALQFTMMFWLPEPSKEYVLFILAGMYGLTDGIWQTQINALYGSLFSKESEAAFSNYRMWESLGFIIAFAYSNYLCTNAKLYILTCVLIVGMACYLVVEIMHRKELSLKIGEIDKVKDTQPVIGGYEMITSSTKNDEKLGQ